MRVRIIFHALVCGTPNLGMGNFDFWERFAEQPARYSELEMHAKRAMHLATHVYKARGVS